MVDPELSDCVCYSCGRHLINPSHQGTAFTRESVITAFRCYYCGRMFCGACAGEHFGED